MESVKNKMKYTLQIRALLADCKLTVCVTFGLIALSSMIFLASATGRSRIALFFLDNAEESAFILERRNVDMPEDLIEGMKVVVENLIVGSRENLINTIPKETKLKELFLDKDNKIVYIDFSDSLKNHIGGTTAELLTIQSIFKTLHINFPQTIDKVQLLIDGREIDTLAGHIDLSRPLPIKIFEKKR